MDETRPFPLPATETLGRESPGQPTASSEIRALVAGQKALRRELQTLRVQCWRGEDRLAEIEAALRETEAAREAAECRLREREKEIESLQWLAGGGAFFERGFRLGDGATIVGRAARRFRDAPSGTMIFGPYVRLRPGRYAVAIVARLYAPVPLIAQLTADAVCRNGQHTIAAARFRIWPLMPAQRREFVFSVPDGLHHTDFEVRIWVRRGTPLEVSQLDLRPLDSRAPNSRALGVADGAAVIAETPRPAGAAA